MRGCGLDARFGFALLVADNIPMPRPVVMASNQSSVLLTSAAMLGGVSSSSKAGQKPPKDPEAGRR